MDAFQVAVALIVAPPVTLLFALLMWLYMRTIINLWKSIN